MLSETDLSEILQIEQVFTNVPKGQVAKKEDWQKAFNTEDINKVIEEVRKAPRTACAYSCCRSCAVESSRSTISNGNMPCIRCREKSPPWFLR